MNREEAQLFRTQIELVGDAAIRLAGEVLNRRTAFVAYCDSGMARKIRDEAELTINKLEHLIRCSKNI